MAKTDQVMEVISDFKTVPYICTLCNKSIELKRHLTGHMWLHTELTVTDSYKCKGCKNFVKPRNEIISHMLAHTERNAKPFVCNSCNRSFSKKAHVQKHLWVRAG